MKQPTMKVEKKCPHCGINLVLTPNEHYGLSGLVPVVPHKDGLAAKLHGFLPVIPLICKACDYIELQWYSE